VKDRSLTRCKRFLDSRAGNSRQLRLDGVDISVRSKRSSGVKRRENL